jgi:hypothetical protein
MKMIEDIFIYAIMLFNILTNSFDFYYNMNNVHFKETILDKLYLEIFSNNNFKFVKV